MPELPEIETVKLQLKKHLVGSCVTRIEVLNKKTVQGDISSIENKKIIDVRRLGKALLIDLESDMTIAFHFKMSGQLIYVRNQESASSVQDRIVGGHPTGDFVGKLPSSHTRVVFHLDTGDLYFNDQRMFGWVIINSKFEILNLKFFKSLAPEPFDISADQFVGRIGKTRRPIKVAIMDQEIISGVGNIYANDALWEAGIKPDLSVNQLSIDQLRLLLDKIVLVLNEGIMYGGATMADSKYMDLHGLGGKYQEHFRTYERDGMKCLRNDGGVIEKSVVGGRGTFYCPVCQK